ncbi:Rib/alpha-like domain-containing protein [uncultured Faecalibaculum sp.]|uniref:Rib/alpha-like domain-containing protein n=2 Tax=uncultured Faecalibaculum sp. TaxID=1729681 RepID=UPI002603F17C|nr:Rib/alpha-like domain-containing protein [uncultured Faecalibaculum sp.]
MKHNGFTLSFNSKVLAASGTCAAGLLLLSCAPVMAAENPVQPAETETAVPAAQAGDTTELPVDETQPAAVSATVSQSGQTEAPAVDPDESGDAEDRQTQESEDRQSQEAASGQPDTPAAAETPLEGSGIEKSGQQAQISEAVSSLDGMQDTDFVPQTANDRPMVMARAARSGQESPFQAGQGVLDPQAYTFSFTVGGLKVQPPAYVTRPEDLRFVTEDEAAFLFDALKNNAHFQEGNPALAAYGQTALADGKPVNAGYYYVICTEQGWYNLLNHLSGHYDENHMWQPQFAQATPDHYYNITFGRPYDLNAVAAMGLAATYQITPAPVDLWVRGNQTGKTELPDPGSYSVAAIAENPALQPEVDRLTSSFQTSQSDLALHQDPSDPWQYDVDLSQTGIERMRDLLGSNYLIREIIADHATWQINQAGRFEPAGMDQTVMQLDPVSAAQFIQNLEALPENTGFTFVYPVDTDLPHAGKPVHIMVQYPDGSQDIVQIMLKVLPRTFHLNVVYVDEQGRTVSQSRQDGLTGENRDILYEIPAGYVLADQEIPRLWTVGSQDQTYRILVLKTARPDADQHKPDPGREGQKKQEDRKQSLAVFTDNRHAASAQPGENRNETGGAVPTAAGGTLARIAAWTTAAAGSLWAAFDLRRRSRH